MLSIETFVEPLIYDLFNHYPEVFLEPKEPPTQNHDHHIVIQPNAKSDCVGPYRYPYFQKSKIEKIVQKILQCGIIRAT